MLKRVVIEEALKQVELEHVVVGGLKRGCRPSGGTKWGDGFEREKRVMTGMDRKSKRVIRGD